MIKHLLDLKSLEISEIIQLLDDADLFINGKELKYDNKIVANLFFEPSTRTQYSFEAAEHRLNCKVMSFNKDSSSVQKGETFYDTVKTFSQYVDAVVIRHVEDNYYENLVGKINVPIINGGDGTGNHPTQSLLDLLTIRQEFKKFEGLKIAIVGDILHSRVANTNIEIMRRLGMNVYLCAPNNFKNNENSYYVLDDIISDMDIVMLLRVQFERHKHEMNITKEEYHNQYGLTVNRYKKLKKDAIIMHPAPFNRGIEIADELVECEKSRIFKQMKNGMYIRMAVLKRSFENEGK